MRIPRLLTTLAFLAITAAPLAAADLAKVDRTIAKEPAYQTKAPKYCLLVIGPEAKARVWLVLDGDTLYVDRNGNGDLTEADKKITAKKGEGTDPGEGEYLFQVAELHVGTLVHKDLRVGVGKIDYLATRDEQVKALLAKAPKARGYSVALDVEAPGRTGKGLEGRVPYLAALLDIRGVLQFGDKPQSAPILHFGGPWQVTLFSRDSLTIGRETDLVLAVGTPGLGAGTTAYVAYEGLIPEGVHPKVEISYSAKDGGKPVKEVYELKERC
jgi:hypothetical protein